MLAEAIPVNITVDSAGKFLNVTGVANKTTTRPAT